jgi:guanylate kinase
MRTAPFIITLTGASGCGKTYITDRIISFGETLEKENILFKPKRHWKYVTRLYRDTEIIDKINGKTIDVKSIKAIPEDCEFVYRTYGDEYGLKKSDLEHYLNKGESPIIVINDIRVVEELKKQFPNQVLSLFLFRQIIQDVEEHKKAGQARGGVSESKAISRFERAVALYRVFIENISLFDRVILNIPYEGTNEKGEEVNIGKIQAEGVIRGVIDEKISLNKTINKTPKLFIVSGNAQSGKDDIIRAAKRLGKLQTDILIKYTTRREEDGDDGEIVCKYKPKSSLLVQCEKDFQLELENLEKNFSFENYKQNKKEELQSEYVEKKDKFKDEDEFLRVRFEDEKLQRMNNIKTGYMRFWEALQKEIEGNQTVLSDNPDKKGLTENIYNEILIKYFEENPDYFDLERLAIENSVDYQNEINNRQILNPKGENNSGFLEHEGKDYILYENNKLYGNPIYYGYEIGNLVKDWQNRSKHLVLTASLPNMFRICREQFGQENVITAFTYSQISAAEFIKYADKVTGTAKLPEYDDILRYAYHIADFDYALIFAETSVVNKSGNQKDDLVDQMFRLFRVYNN